jgi:D-alanine-D-alanine ligase
MWCFPVLHGTFGEDGTIQGLFELAGIAYVGSGVLGSAAGMDKDVMKRLFARPKLPIVKHVTLLRAEWEKSPRKAIAQVEAALKYPVFVKPANLGSSVGISKAHDRKELGPALDLAAKYDRKLVVEQGVGGKKAPRRASSRLPCWATTIPRPAWWARSFPARSSTTTRPSISPKARCR